MQLEADSREPGAAAMAFDATLISGRPGEMAPGILFLHGGPHSAYAASYVHSLAFLASLGYNIVIPNYRRAGRQTPRKAFTVQGHFLTTAYHDRRGRQRLNSK